MVSACLNIHKALRIVPGTRQQFMNFKLFILIIKLA